MSSEPVELVAAAAAAAAAVDTAVVAPVRASTNRVLMVFPDHFSLNEETFADNKFMNRVDDAVDVLAEVQREFCDMRAKLEARGVHVVTFGNPRDDGTPDAVFPNNWFSTHRSPAVPDGLMFLYPMKCESRRRERKPKIIAELRASCAEFVDVAAENEAAGRILEGTGAIVFDRVTGDMYVSLSERACREVAEQVRDHLIKAGVYSDPRCVFFESRDAGGATVYHTNVMMAVGTTLAVLCADSIATVEQRNAVEHRLRETGHEILHISLAQMGEFCGNVLEVSLNAAGTERALVMSERARKHFTPEQLALIERHYGPDGIISADVSLIETIGGGGTRCMMAELF